MRNTAPMGLLQRVILRICNAMGLLMPKPSNKIGVPTDQKTRSAPRTNSQPAKRPRKRKSKPVQAGNPVKLSKAARQAAQILEEIPFPVRGLPQPIPAKQSGKPKPKRSPVLSTTAAPLHKLVKQLPSDKAPHGKLSVTPASQTPQHAKSKPKRKA